MQCRDLQGTYAENGFAVARQLVANEALQAAFGPEGLPAALTVGRYGYEESSTLTTLKNLPLGVKDMTSLTLVHNGHIIHAVRGLWPLIMTAAMGAACIFGLLPESLESLALHELRSQTLSSLGVEGYHEKPPVLRLNAHMKLAPKMPGVSNQHVKGHRDYSYWRHRYKSRPQNYRDAFINSTVTAWIPLVSVGDYGSMVYGRERSLVSGVERVARVQVPADPGDVLFHSMKTFHWSTLMDNTSDDVRCHVELRFHNAAVLDSLEMSDDEMHQVMRGPPIENVDTQGSYATLLDVVYQSIQKVRWRFNAETVHLSMGGSKWNNPLQVPKIGLGTGRLWPPESIVPSIQYFLALGGRHLDTAASYWSQQVVASVCRASGVAAKDIVLTTKIWPLGFEESLEAARAALKELDGTGQVVILLHMPGRTADGKPKKGPEVPASCRDEARPNSWRRCRMDSFLALASLREAGVVSGIGVSNFLKRHLEELRRDLRLTKRRGASRGLLRTWPPDVVQHEVHLRRREEELVKYCRLWNITVVSYGTLGSPEAKSKLLDHPFVRRGAEMEGLAPAQVLMKWALQRKLHLIPTTSKPHHLQQLVELPQLPDLNPATVALLDSVQEFEESIYHPYLDRIE